MSKRAPRRGSASRRVPARLRALAPAKINLTLRILGTRPDGYRELRTIFQSLALHDTLTFSLSDESTRGSRVRGLVVEGSEPTGRRVEGLTLSTNDPACPTDGTNLVAKAAQRLWEEAGGAGRPPAVHVHIEKRIPSQAGLGGGSSDAAATLRALTVLWRLRLAPDRLASIARSLGADVAYFLEGGSVLGVERGDVLFPLLDRPRSEVLLVLPPFGVSTRDAYGWWQEASDRAGQDAARVPNEWINDLQAPVAARHPEIDRLTEELRRAGADYSAMSGSGSAVFGLFDTPRRAATAARRIAGLGCQTILTRTTNRAAYGRVVRPRP